jgi:hypothetical protein
LVALRYQGGKRFISSADDEQWVEFQLDKGASAVDVALYGFPLKLRKSRTRLHRIRIYPRHDCLTDGP